MSQNYDILQVCENGHKITDCYNNNPEERKKFCQDCGLPTIISCSNCGAEIRGAKMEVVESILDARVGRRRMMPVIRADVPKYCPNCGESYLWTQQKIQTAIQILVEFGDLEDAEKKTIEQDVKNIAKDVPEAELSARRIKRIWKRAKNVGYEVIMEFASRTAANVLKDP